MSFDNGFKIFNGIFASDCNNFILAIATFSTSLFDFNAHHITLLTEVGKVFVVVATYIVY